MKSKKALLCILLVAISLSFVGCNKKSDNNANENVKKNDVKNDVSTDYSNFYRTAYNNYSKITNQYSIYGSLEKMKDAYKGKKYPGNEKYLKDVKEAYKNTRDNTKKFVKSLKDGKKSTNSEVQKMNDKLINQGEMSIKEMNNKIDRLNKISKRDMKKNKDDFLSLVYSITGTNNKVQEGFTKMINDMNLKMGIPGK